MNGISELNETVIKNGFCIGCGACSFASNGTIVIKKDSFGKYGAVIENIDKNKYDNVLNVCPFYNHVYNETKIGKELFSKIKGVNHDDYLGYSLVNYAGFVKSKDYRIKGSSGGFGSWIASKLLEEGYVDKVIHVKSSKKSDLLFKYQISSNLDEIQEGAKSKYYPIEMSEVLNFVSRNDYKYLFVGIPCFIKAIRQLQLEFPILRERIKFTLGLVCGHLKSDFFAKSIAWELGVHPSSLKSIDFRVKNNLSVASNYNVKVTGLIEDKEIEFESSTKSLIASNWGHGLFKYNACDYCDDVLAETADVTIGDAWLPEYNNDSRGTNIIVIRNVIIRELFNQYRNEIHIDEISSKKVYDSQVGGFRHRREGLHYRLSKLDQSNQWRPQKRFNTNTNISNRRKKIYDSRLLLAKESFIVFDKAIEKNDYNIFSKRMKKLIRQSERLYRGNIVTFTFKRVVRIFIKALKLKV